MCDQDSNLTMFLKQAMSETDCICNPGSRTVVAGPWPNARRCEKCVCTEGQYMYQGPGVPPLCTTGKETEPPVCLPCSATCNKGQYGGGYCSGEGTSNNMTCLACTLWTMSVSVSSPGGTVCPAVSRRDVLQGSQTIIQSASEFRAHCTAVRGLDCMRRQALVYPFDGMDILEDLAPWNRVLQPRSASGFSNGPSMQVFKGVDFLDGSDPYSTVGRWPLLRGSAANARTSAAFFNASNHEYFIIPPMANVFDPSLAARILPTPPTSRPSSYLPAVWEQGMTLCMWYMFATMSDSWQTLFEMSNGYRTEHVYVRRYADTAELLLGVSHGMYKREFVTTGGWPCLFRCFGCYS